MRMNESFDRLLKVIKCIASVAWLAAASPLLAQDEGEESQTAGPADTGEGESQGEPPMSWAQGGDPEPVVIERDGERILEIPPRDWGVEMIEGRAAAQRAGAEGYDVFHGFGFTDRQPQSGIDFTHRIVSDAGKTYKPVHYDHGNGVAVADVDGDGLLDVYLTNQLGGNALYRNLGGGKFEDMTEEAGVAVADRVSVAAAFADADNDGDLDLFVTTVRMGNLYFENVGDGKFRDRTEQSGLAYIGHSSAPTFFDADRDGLLDLYVANVGSYTIDERHADGSWVGRVDAFAGQLHPDRWETSRLYINQGDGRFADVTEAWGLDDPSWTGDATPIDVNGDGWLDLYQLDMQGDDNLFVNRQGEGFEDASADYFPASPWGAMGVKAFDFDNDGDADLALTDMHSDMSRDIPPPYERQKSQMQWPDEFLKGGDDNVFGNAFFVNQGDGEFVEASDRLQTENYWPWGLSVGDLNADGSQDVFIASSMNYPFTYGINSVLLNESGGKFQHAEFLLGVEPRRDGRFKTPWFELDCSGADAGHEHCQGIEGEFTVYANLGSRSSVIFDLDADGDLDIVTNDFNSEPMVLVSNLSERRKVNWIGVRLVGSESNRDGLGAIVRLHAGDLAQTRFHDGKSGYLSQSSMPLYFGLGEATTVDKAEVVWPSGAIQTVSEGLEPGRVVEIREPEKVAEPPAGAESTP